MDDDIDPLFLLLRDEPDVSLRDFITRQQAREIGRDLGLRVRNAAQLEQAIRDLL